MVERDLNHIFLHLATLTQLSLLKNIFYFFVRSREMWCIAKERPSG